MTWDETRALLAPCLPEQIRSALDALPLDSLREIRIRAGQNTQLCTADGRLNVPWQPIQRQIAQLAEALTDRSLYARTEETGRGYVTLQGGHRMGLCGQARRRDGQTFLQHIGSLCIRIAVQRPGCGEPLRAMAREGLLLIGPPGSGKTTLLRDLARLLSHDGFQTAVIDERGELAAASEGQPLLDVGCADVLSGLGKPEAAEWLIRAMTPQLIITDELGHAHDADALLDAHACGTNILASVHGRSLNEAVRRSAVRQLVTSRCFGSYAVLSPDEPGRILAAYDRNGSPVALS